MSKWQIDAMLDAGLAYITSNVTEVYLCTSQPADRAGAISAAVASRTSGLSGFTGPADGDTSGRKITKDAENGITASASGDATHVALCSGSALLYVTTVTTQTVTSGNTVNIAAWDIELADVTP